MSAPIEMLLWAPDREPAGFVGTSGVKIFDPTVINHRARMWAGIS